VHVKAETVKCLNRLFLNDNDLDLHEFVALCGKINVYEVYISRETYAYLNKQRLPEQTVMAMKYMVNMLLEKDIPVKPFGEIGTDELEEFML